MTEQCASRPSPASRQLLESLAVLDTIEPDMNAVRLGIPRGEGEWTTCADVIESPDYLRAWQQAVAVQLAESFSAPERQIAITAAACVLDWYAYAPGFLAGALFHVARRVPDVTPEAVAFRRDPGEHWISGTALLTTTFWCLPGDPAAHEEDASVVDHEQDLAAIAREQVRLHADRFLATYDPGVRLPRRALRGVFFDSLDSAPWIAEELAPGSSCLESAEVLLPGRTEHFADRSRLYELTDLDGRRHISRRRVACCESYRIEPGGEGCLDCPRTSDARRAELSTALPC